ncbi:MAG: hypothetical protein P8K65_05745 [Acidimicrobiales bacterium]|nr:hypothetical protein [Acidimicrobiales bacterium]
MTAYDPQARRARPSPSDESPVDGLLEPVPVVDAVPDDVSDVSDVCDEAPATALETESEELKPFETPQVEMTDERADLLHRLGALGAVVALVVALMLWRRRRAD